MSRSLNKVQLIGNVGSDPEVRATQSGARVAKLSLATNRTFPDKSGQQQERTDWHRLTFFGKLADIVEQWVHKGDKIYVEGRLEYSQTQDDQGATKYWTDIVVNEMMMLGGQGGAGGGGAAGGEYAGGAARGARGGGRGFGGGSGSGGGAPAPDRPLSEPDDDLPF
jgi:single-strand DNA-binding protein